MSAGRPGLHSRCGRPGLVGILQPPHAAQVHAPKVEYSLKIFALVPVMAVSATFSWLQSTFAALGYRTD